MPGRNRIRGLKTKLKYYYTSGQEYRFAKTGEEYIGPYFIFEGTAVSGADPDSEDARNLLPYSTSPEVIRYRAKYEPFNDYFKYPKPYRPKLKPNMEEVNRMFVFDKLTERFFEISPRDKKYYKKDKPLRKRFLVEGLQWTLVGLQAIDKNIDKIAESSFPGKIKDLYLDPTEYINDTGALTLIDNIPLFATVEQALAYGASVGLEGYHTHMYRGRLGFMAGENHGVATGDYEGDGGPVTGTNTSMTDDTSNNDAPTDTGTSSTGGSSGGSSGGGGYG